MTIILKKELIIRIISNQFNIIIYGISYIKSCNFFTEFRILYLYFYTKGAAAYKSS